VNGVKFLVLVNKQTFLDMFKKGVLKGNKKEHKDWSITINKKHYVGNGSWEKYCNMLKVEQQK
jgi:hypothetical protein